MDNLTDEVTLNGSRYISVKRAAELSEYTTDYVGQLCRAKKVEATRIGRNWYVDEASLIEHKQSTLEDSVEKKEKAAPVVQKRNIFKSSFIIYSKDERPLFPELNDKTPKSVKIEIKSYDKEGIGFDSIFTKASGVIEEAARSTVSITNVFQRLALAAVVVVIFVGFFTLNGSYTLNLIKTGVQSTATTIMSTEAAKTIDEEIILPYELVAVEIYERVNVVLYPLLNEE